MQCKFPEEEAKQTSGSKRWDDVVPHLLVVRRAKIVRIVMYAPEFDQICRESESSCLSGEFEAYM
jgi:hypothetical protein